MSKKLLTEKNISSVKLARKIITSKNDSSMLTKDVHPISKRTLTAIESNYNHILEMQDIILAAPAMNGGFTTLLYKVENIEQCQTQLVEKIDQIHSVMYEPDTGLYARIKNVEKSSIPEGSLDNIEKDIQEIKIWKHAEEKTSVKDDVRISENNKMLNFHEIIIKDLQETVNKYNTVIKWLLVSIGGGLLSLIGKIVYEFVSGRVKII